MSAAPNRAALLFCPKGGDGHGSQMEEMGNSRKSGED